MGAIRFAQALILLLSLPLLAQTPSSVPFINQSLVPVSTVPGGTGFTLTVSGTGFVSGSVVNWNGSSRPTTFVSGSQLTVAVAASDIATAGTASVTVSNPGPGGGLSNTVFFPITSSTSSVYLRRSDLATGSAPFSVTVGDFTRTGKLSLATANYGNGGDLRIELGLRCATRARPHTNLPLPGSRLRPARTAGPPCQADRH